MADAKRRTGTTGADDTSTTGTGTGTGSSSTGRKRGPNEGMRVNPDDKGFPMHVEGLTAPIGYFE